MSNPLLTPQEQAHIDNIRANHSTPPPYAENATQGATGVLAYLKTRDYSKVYQIATNILSGIAVLLIAYLTTQNLTPMFNAGNIPVVIAGMFPVLASFGMFLGVLISEPMSLLRVLYLFGMFATLVLGV